MTQSFKKVIENCVCGHKHQCSIQNVVIGKDALQQVPTLLKNIRKVLIVSDGNTRPLAFEKVTSALETAGISWCEAYFDQTNVVIPNEASVSFILGNTASDVEALVGIGSGVISDLCKDLKNRYTLLNLLRDVGLIRRFASQMQLLADRN